MKSPTIFLYLIATNAIAAAADVSAQFDVAVRDISGKLRSGRLTALSAQELSVNDNNGNAFALPMTKLLRIDRRSPPRNGKSAAAFVYLSNGDRLAVTAAKIDGDDLHVVWNGIPGKPALKLPLLSVRAILLQRPAGGAEFRRLESLLLGHRQQHDLLVLRNGDQVTGRLNSLDADRVVMSGTAGRIARSNVRAVVFDPRYVETPKPTERILLRLADGTRLSAKSAVLKSGGNLRVQLQTGGEFDVPWSSVVSLQRVGGNVLPLSALTPATFEHTPYLDGKRPLRTDRNVLGGPLVLRGREYSLGLGMHSRSRAVYDLPRNAVHFLATIGIDDAARGKGAAVFVVQLDGKTVFTSPLLRGKDAPVQVGPIPLVGHKRLTLAVEFGPDGDILDYADWCDAVLVGTSKVGSRRSDDRMIGARSSSSRYSVPSTKYSVPADRRLFDLRP
jgi:NPCBM/NEW2 domain